ncbi:PcfJ domain-containing protein [Nitrobacter sp.]|uniref:PcfJ domain-containing protein n=1 Tax=Nitrobacter sp. TaxID=29420 RepID=UPI003F65352E
MKDDGQKSLLQWLAPELAAKGVLLNEPWVQASVRQVEDMFPVKPLAIAALMMVAVEPFAIDYLRQAPVLVVAAAQGMECFRPMEREFVLRNWQTIVHDRPKLRDLLKYYGLVRPLRALKGEAFRAGPAEYQVIQNLCDVPPSPLAQAIPTSIRHQHIWLRALGEWSETMCRREQSARALFDWAVRAMGNHAEAGDTLDQASAVADYAAIHIDTFNRRWSYQRAFRAALEWHEELARASSEKAYFLTHKMGWDEVIDYGDLPGSTTIEGYEMVALQTGAALHAEGADMHHCVASYAGNVIRGFSRIFSVRKDGRRVATFEISKSGFLLASGEFLQLPSSKGPLYKLVQLKGPYNAEVPQEVEQAIGGFISGLNETARAVG